MTTGFEQLEPLLPHIAVLCRRYGVEKLDLFGSATSPRFDTNRSDFDFIVSFSLEARSQAFDNFFGLREDLKELLGREVDLLTDQQIRNPYLRREIDENRRALYAA